MRILLITSLITCVLSTSFAQTYVSEKSSTTFFSSAPLEDITAQNDKGRSVFDADKGEIVFSIPIKEFQFRKSLMQEHFNEKYMESDKYPTSTFSGKVTGFSKDSSNDEVWAEGTLEIHGIKKNIRVPGTLNFNSNKLHLECKFTVRLEDFDIEIPSILFQNIAEEVEVTLIYDYKLHEN